MILRVLICWVVLGCVASVAGALPADLSGYNKTLGFIAGSGGSAVSWLVNRYRFDTLVPLADGVSLRTILDNEIYGGSLVSDPAFTLLKDYRGSGPLDTTLTIIDTGDVYDRLNLYRLYLAIHHEPFEITIGNQRVPLGRGRFYSPADYFNPLSPLAIEADREGVQGINGTYYTDYFSFFQVAVSYDDSWAARRTLVKYQTNAGEADIAFFVGNKDGDNVAGGDLAVNVMEGTVRWEGLYNDGDGNIQMVVNYDRVYGSGWYVATEFVYNRNGLRTAREIRDALAAVPAAGQTGSAGLFSWEPLARYYLGATISREILTLMSGSLSTLVSLVDGSGYVGVSLAYNILQDWDVELSNNVFYGKGQTEYGSYPDLYALSLQYSF